MVLNSKFLSMLGLAKRAGQVIIGTDLVTKALPSRRVRLVIYPENASANTEKKITDKCKYYGVQCIRVGETAEELARALGKASLACAVGVVDENFSKALLSLTSNETR